MLFFKGQGGGRQKSGRPPAEPARLGRCGLFHTGARPDRRIIHARIQEIDGVTTFSTGQEPNRRVVVAPEGGEAAGAAGKGGSQGQGAPRPAGSRPRGGHRSRGGRGGRPRNPNPNSNNGTGETK